MNIIPGIVESVSVKGSLSLVRVKAGQTLLTAIVIDTPETKSYLNAGAQVHVIFKETEVIIGPGQDHNISLRNKLTGRVTHIESGDLLSRLIVETTVGPVVSVITTNAVRNLQIEEGSEVTAMIKTNEMMLSK